MILESSSESLLQNKAIELEKSSAIPLPEAGIKPCETNRSATVAKEQGTPRRARHKP
jgi:hypothetical protein